MTDKRKSLRLGDILDSFKTTLTKTSADGGTPSPVADDAQADLQAQAAAEAEAQAAAEAQAQAQAQADPDGDGDNDTANDAIADAARNVVNADQQLDNAVDALKTIAKQAQEKESSALEKDASEFGKIFADSFLSELEERAEFGTLQKNAYDMTLQKVAEEELPEMFENITKEAYDITMAKVAEVSEDINEDTYNSIIKEAYDITMSTLDESSTLKDLEEITKVAYEYTLNQIENK